MKANSFTLFTFLVLFISLAGCGERKITTGTDLITAMHDRYEGKWYKYLTFKQFTSFLSGGTVNKTQVWHEALQIPGKLHIHFDSLTGGNGVLFNSDTQYIFVDSELKAVQPLIHPLMVLGFDVYSLSPEETIKKLGALGFPIEPLREDVWQGRPVFVVGASKDDERKSQFWIDQENLYFVRYIMLNPNDATLIQEAQFNKYEKLGGGWVAKEVIFKVNGEITMLEEYTDVQAPASLPESLFTPFGFMEAKW